MFDDTRGHQVALEIVCHPDFADLASWFWALGFTSENSKPWFLWMEWIETYHGISMEVP